MIAAPFKREHLEALRGEATQPAELALVNPHTAEQMELTNAWTILHADRPLLVGGIVEVDRNGYLWAFVSKRAGPQMFGITRMVARYLAIAPFKRIETSVRADFIDGCRWVKLFGFDCEGLMRKFGLDGADHYRYARVI